jgi:hypothetical protein
MQRHYIENSKEDLLLAVMDVLGKFMKFNFTEIFKSCGYGIHGFDAAIGLKQNLNDFDYEE